MGIGLGTCIIALKQSNQIIVVADSRMRFPSEGKYKSICKIIQVEKIFFASSGLSLASETGFNIQSICKEAIKQGGNIRQCLNRLEKLIKRPLMDVFNYIKQNDPNQYNNILRHNPVTVSFFGIEDDKPVLSARKFIPKGTKRIKTVKLDDVADGSTIHMGCPYAWDNAYHRGIIPDPLTDLIGSIRGAVQVEIDGQATLKQKDRMIAGPISAIEIDLNGARWIEQGKCPDIKPF